jgi:hypothetical protein
VHRDGVRQLLPRQAAIDPPLLEPAVNLGLVGLAASSHTNSINAT